MKLKLYKDSIHGLYAESGSKTTAWGLIRAYCHENNLEVPKMDKIIIVKGQPKRKPKVILRKTETEEIKDLGGRPCKYRPEYAEQVYKLCLLGATDAEIGEFFEVDERTINRWKEEYERFCQSIHAGKRVADMEVSASLYQTTQDRQVFEEAAFKVKKVRWNDKGQREETEEIEVVPVKRVIPADFRSQQFWLKNRKADKWREKVEVDQTNINLDVSVTDEEARRIKAALDKDI